MPTDIAIAPPVPARRAARKPRPAPLEYSRKRWLQAVVAFNFIFLYFPIVSLIALAQKRVYEASGVELVPEVKRVGEFL